jgi:membrane-associated phospholipid phosphatase
MDAQVPLAGISGNTRKLYFPLHSTDMLLFVFWGSLSIVSLVLHSRIQLWWAIVATDVAAAVLICALAYASQITASKVLRWVHDWAAFALVVFTYKQLYYVIRPIHGGQDFDQLLIALDRFLFRVNPTEWLARFANPYLTEVLQIAYSLFYVLFLAVGIELYRRQDLSQFRFARFTMVYGFLLSYIGYFFLPAVGPRFTLHDFSKIDIELPGLVFTNSLRWFVNIWESIHSGASNAVALASAQRDVFPSGHTMMALVAIALSYRYRLKIRGYVLVLGLLLIIATVYLRYHYLVDIVAGALLALACMRTVNGVYALLKSDSRE